MKFGFRKPSIKRSISARTTGQAKRAIKRALIPGYGKRGMGILHPKKSLVQPCLSPHDIWIGRYTQSIVQIKNKIWSIKSEQLFSLL